MTGLAPGFIVGLAPATATAVRTIIHLAMDVHKESITSAVLPSDAKTPTRVNRLFNDPGALSWCGTTDRQENITDLGSRLR